MTVSFRNTSGSQLEVYGKLVDIDALYPVDDDLAPAKDQPDDAYLTGRGDTARLWPKATWTHVGGSAKKSEGKEG